MKKRILTVGVIAALALVSFLASCKKEESCMCNETDYEGYNATRKIDPSSFGASNCADLQIKLKIQAGGEYDYNCY